MTIHKEGYPTIIVTMIFVAIINFVSFFYLKENSIVQISSVAISVFLIIIVLQFFRHPKRTIKRNEKFVFAPADGKVVVIEEANEPEVLKDKRLQISIFMSPINVHVNRYPISGEVSYSKYHPGKYLVAWHPKSSTDNERTTIVIQNGAKIPVLIRQIAGALARRIVCYPQQGWKVKQGEELGFIKFGSRVDLLLPLNSKVMVKLNDKVVGGETIIAELKNL